MGITGIPPHMRGRNRPRRTKQGSPTYISKEVIKRTGAVHLGVDVRRLQDSSHSSGARGSQRGYNTGSRFKPYKPQGKKPTYIKIQSTGIDYITKDVLPNEDGSLDVILEFSNIRCKSIKSIGFKQMRDSYNISVATDKGGAVLSLATYGDILEVLVKKVRDEELFYDEILLPNTYGCLDIKLNNGVITAHYWDVLKADKKKIMPLVKELQAIAKKHKLDIDAMALYDSFYGNYFTMKGTHKFEPGAINYNKKIIPCQNYGLCRLNETIETKLAEQKN